MFLAGVPMWLFMAPVAAIARRCPDRLPMLHGYQRKRIDTFLDPESDPLGAGYHIAQSKIAIGSGGIWGKGYLNGSQSHLDYLPEGHTDFAFAALGRGMGTGRRNHPDPGVRAVIRWGMKVGANARTRFAQLSAAGLTACIFFYASINLMMVMGLAPVVGVPLPLISYRRLCGDDCDAYAWECSWRSSGSNARLRAADSPLNRRGCAPPKPMLPAPPLKARFDRQSIRLTAVDA